jgi:nucleoid-associated protein YgaU
MSVKSTLKTVKLNESVISMILGAVVIVVAGLLIVNYFSRQDNAVSFPTGEVADVQQTETATETRVKSGEKFHTVMQNDNLWKIAEKYYESGYNWVDIAQANNLTSGNDVRVGQELVIPDVEPRNATVAVLSTQTENKEVAEKEVQKEVEEEATQTFSQPEPTQTSISGTSYTVVRGDTLWDIAVRAYGDGYRWVDIAQANNLLNPDVIHSGNVFVIPRS